MKELVENLVEGLNSDNKDWIYNLVKLLANKTENDE